MYFSSYLERLKIKLAALPLEGELHVPNGSEVLHAWGDLVVGEQVDSHKPIGRWLRLSTMPYEEFIVWCTQHGINGYFQEDGVEMLFVRVQTERMSLEKLMMQIPEAYSKPEQTNFDQVHDMIRQSLALLRTLRVGGVGRGLSRLFIMMVKVADRHNVDLATELFSLMVSDRLGQVDAPDEVGHRKPR